MAFNQSMTFFSCDKKGCKFFAKSRFALNGHTAKHHPKPDIKIEEKNWLKCAKCDFKSNFSNGETLENNSHMRKHEDKCGKVNYEIQKCDDPSCKFKISSLFLLAKHERKEHGITTRLFPGNKKIKLKKKSAGSHALFKCQKCGFSTVHKHSLRKHTVKCSQQDSIRYHSYITEALIQICSLKLDLTKYIFFLQKLDYFFCQTKEFLFSTLHFDEIFML